MYMYNAVIKYWTSPTRYRRAGSPPSWIFSEVKFDVSGSRGRPASTCTSNSVKISQSAAKLWWFICF